MRLPLIWRPAPSAGVAPATVTAPVGLVDLAPTFCQIADVPATDWMEGQALPTTDQDAEQRGMDRVLTEWDSELLGVAVHLRTITRDGWVCTAYQPGTVHDGTEGELYDLADDPLQQVNRWDDPAVRALRDDLVDDLHAHLRPAREPRLPVDAPG
jgi:arylsulfatase A-like enzyme